MGTIESKIKGGYSTNTKPLFSATRRQALRPCRGQNLGKSKCVSFDLEHTSTSEQDQSESGPVAGMKGKKPSGRSHIITNSRQYPYSSIGLVSCQLGEQKVIGSGCLIGNNFVLTCAHNLWSFRDKSMGKNISFTPMFNSQADTTTYRAKKVHLPQLLQTVDSFSDDLFMLDYAVIELESQNIQQDYGTMALNFHFKITPGEPLSILGFNRQGKDVTLSEMSGSVTEDDGLLKYDMMAGYGMSGAPIVAQSQEGFQVVGLHLFCRQRNGHVERGGIQLSGHILRELEKWCLREEEELDLREKGLGKEGLKYLSKHKWNNLVSLNLSRNGFQHNSAKYLKRGHWKNLVNFDLGGNLIGKEGAQALAQSEMTAIVTLNLWGNCIGKGGAYCLSMAGWENLTNLNLYNNQIGDQGVQYLTHANWKRLNSLNLGKNGISFAGAQFILEGKWPHLASLNLWGNELSGEESILKARLLQHFICLKFLYF